MEQLQEDIFYCERARARYIKAMVYEIWVIDRQIMSSLGLELNQILPIWKYAYIGENYHFMSSFLFCCITVKKRCFYMFWRCTGKWWVG